mmetsp:Transcript_55923/g.137382  ORF Transcript_55923/g.137382 Transcript_55923/m.137382 type:complete len:84 (-) Transcript_55923:707-958(-)
MDAVYSAPLHFDGQLLVDVVDEAWAAATLPIEDVSVPEGVTVHLDDDEVEEVVALENEDAKWTELGLSDLIEDANQSADSPRT